MSEGTRVSGPRILVLPLLHKINYISRFTIPSYIYDVTFLRNYQLAALIRKLISCNWMSKHKSKVLTVKIQLEVKLPQAVITKIRTLPLIFPKIFRAAVCQIIRSGYFWHYYVCKTINLCSRKVAFIFFNEICSASFFMKN